MKKFSKRTCVVTVCIGLLLIVVIAVCLAYPWNQLDKHKEYGLFAAVNSGYSRVQSEHKAYAAGDVIRLDISTAFFTDVEEAELAQDIRFRIEDNDVFDVEIYISDPQDPDSEPMQLAYDEQEKCWILNLQDAGIDPEDLVYRKNIFGKLGIKSITGSVDRKNFDFTFTAYLKVKAAAPENDSGRIYITAFVSGEKDSYGNAVQGQARIDYLDYTKSGDTITLD